MQAISHNTLRLLPASMFLIVAALRWILWRNAKARGLSPAQFALANDTLDRMGIGRFPICVAALSLAHHRNSGSMLAAETAGLEVIFGGLALIFLWVTKKRKARA